MLLQHGRHARAIVLAITASEELSKFQLCLDALIEGGSLPDSRSREWTNHRGKLGTVRAFELAFMDEDPSFDFEVVRADVVAQQQVKKGCLYVDHEGGMIARPSDVQADAAELLARGRANCVFLREVFSLITPDLLAEVLEHRPQIEALLETLVDDGDPAGTTRRLRAVFAASQTGDVQALELAFSVAAAEVAVSEQGPDL